MTRTEGEMTPQERILAVGTQFSRDTFHAALNAVLYEQSIENMGGRSLAGINFAVGGYMYDSIEQLPTSAPIHVGFVTDASNYKPEGLLQDNVSKPHLFKVTTKMQAFDVLKSHRYRAERDLERIYEITEHTPDRRERAIYVHDIIPEIVTKARVLMASTSLLHGIAKQAIQLKDYYLALLSCQAAGDFEDNRLLKDISSKNFGDIVLEDLADGLKNEEKYAEPMELYALKEMIQGVRPAQQ